MDARVTAIAQFQLTHRIVDMVLGGLSPEIFNARPPGKITSIASIYAHMVLSEDWLVQELAQGKAKLYDSGGWAAKTGGPAIESAELAPGWADTLVLDLARFKPYAEATYAATEAFLQDASEAALARVVDSPLGDKIPAFDLIANLGVFHAAEHTGEMAALKGVMGEQGLPF